MNLIVGLVNILLLIFLYLPLYAELCLHCKEKLDLDHSLILRTEKTEILIRLSTVVSRNLWVGGGGRLKCSFSSSFLAFS